MNKNLKTKKFTVDNEATYDKRFMEMSVSDNRSRIERENKLAVTDDEVIFDRFVVKILNIHTSDKFMAEKYKVYRDSQDKKSEVNFKEIIKRLTDLGHRKYGLNEREVYRLQQKIETSRMKRIKQRKESHIRAMDYNL